MILDALLQFSNGQDLGQVANYVSTNVIDFGIGTAANPAIPGVASGGGARDMGIGDAPALKFVVQVVEAFTSAGAATMSVAVQGAIDDGTGAPSTFTTYYTSPVYALATLAVAGNRLLDIDMPRPPAGVAIPRFIRLLYVVADATTTAGTVSAYLVLDRPDQAYKGTNTGVLGGYQAGITVSN